MYHPDDTIAAIASAGGGAARGIVRASGPRLLEILDRCFVAAPGESPSAGKTAQVISGHLAPPTGDDSISAARIPCDLYLWPGAQSYTREPSAELHLPGSPPILTTALRRLAGAGARVAEPGEFTLRAFLAGRIDLTEAEAVLGVVDAADREALDAALAQLAGGIGRELAELRSTLLDLVAHLEAGLDFADEDLPFITAAQLDGHLRTATEQVRRLLDQMTSRSEAAEATRVVLIGQPNVGKSSLFNALSGSGAAIVSPVAGTTRDYLTATIDLAGLRLELIDTAGAEAAKGALGAAAQAMTTAATRPAAIRVLCIDSTRPLVDAEQRQLSDIDQRQGVIVLTKCDQPRRLPSIDGAISTSAATGAGIDALGVRLAALAGASGGGVVLATAVRSRESLRLANEALERAAGALADGGGEELIAADLRLALDELGKVAGAVHTDDILDRVFSRFCIGK